jgi:hypothetical protein
MARNCQRLEHSLVEPTRIQSVNRNALPSPAEPTIAAASMHASPLLREFGPSLYSADGPTVSFHGFPYPTRMALARLQDDRLWVWSPIALTGGLVAAVEALGTVQHIVSPNRLHHLFLRDWALRWPNALLHAPPGLARKRPDLHFDVDGGESNDPSLRGIIDQVVFRGSFAMEEVVFFHRESRTAIFGDLIQRFPASAANGWKGALMRLSGLVGGHGGTPSDWRATFLRRSPARAARDTVLDWNPERLLIAHGECAQTNAAGIIAAALAWI